MNSCVHIDDIMKVIMRVTMHTRVQRQPTGTRPRGAPALQHPPRNPLRRHIAANVQSAAATSSGSARNTLQVSAPNDDTGGRLAVDVQAPAGARVFTVSLKKPLGLVLTERGGRIEVESVAAGGHAAAAGVAPGDELLATTARAQGGGASVRGQLVLLPAGGQQFNTVAAAIRSNTCSQCLIHLVFARPEAE